MAALNFECILMMLKGGGTILRSTLCCQDGINLGDIHFCLILRTLHMQCISLKGLCTLLSEGAFMPPQSNMSPELSRTTANLLMFQVDSEHKRIVNVYMGLVVRRVDCCLYSHNQINDFIQDIDVNLREACDALKAGRDASKRHAYCLFVDNLSGVMSVPTDPPYCLVYPTTYVKGAEPDHFDTRNSPMNSAFSPIMSRSFHSLLVCRKMCVCSYTFGNVVRWYTSSLLGSYVQQEYYVAVIQNVISCSWKLKSFYSSSSWSYSSMLQVALNKLQYIIQVS